MGVTGEVVEPIAVLAAVTGAYVAYHYLGVVRPGDDRAQAHAVFRRRWIGAALLGLVPAIVSAGFGRGPRELGLVPHDFARSLLYAAGMIAFALPGAYLNAKKPSAWAAYPQVRLHVWDAEIHRSNTLAWIGYLAGYELMFRGVFLFTMARWAGEAPALAIVTSVYVLVHLEKPAGETVGSMVMGVLFGASALATGGVLAPFLAHAAIAITSDLMVLRARRV